jgi:hypothetical protein
MPNSTLILNAAPQTIANGSNGIVTQVNNASVITIAPQNQDVTVAVTTAGAAMPGSPFSIPGTVQMPYPIVSTNWGGNNVSVLNASQVQSANVSAGFFGVASPPSPTLPISSSYQTINQFQSIGGNSTSGPATIQLLATNNNVTAVMLFGNGNTPQMYVLNYVDSLPPIFQQLPTGVLHTVPGNLATITGNFWGNYMFLVNVSMAVTSGAQVRLLGN